MGYIDSHKYQPIPLYTSIAQQIWRSVNAENVYKACPIYHPKNAMIPLQMQRLMRINTLSSISLCYAADWFDGTNTSYTVHDATILSKIDSGDVLYRTKEGWDDILITGNTALTSNLPVGWWFWVITDGTNTWYSEVFNVVSVDIDVDLQFLLGGIDLSGVGGGATVQPTVTIGGIEVTLDL